MAIYHTLSTLESLQTLYEKGYRSDVVDKAVAKIIAMEREQAKQTLLELETRLTEYEKLYEMASDDFYIRFQTGKLGDDVEFIEWSAFFEMREATISPLEILDRDLE